MLILSTLFLGNSYAQQNESPFCHVILKDTVAPVYDSKTLHSLTFPSHFTVKTGAGTVGGVASYDRVAISSPTHPAYEKIEASTVKLLGSGVEAQDTHEIISLACVGTPDQVNGEASCNTLRFVYVTSDRKEMYYIGKPLSKYMGNYDEDNFAYSIFLSNNQKIAHPDRKTDREKAFELSDVKSIVLQLKQQIRFQEDYQTSWHTQIIACEANTAIVKTFPVFNISKWTKHLFSTFDKTFTSFSNKDGWNWSEKPYRLVQGGFEVIMVFVESGDHLEEGSGFSDQIIAIRK